MNFNANVQMTHYTKTMIFLTMDVSVHGEAWCCSLLPAELSNVVLLDTNCQILSFTPVETATVAKKDTS